MCSTCRADGSSHPPEHPPAWTCVCSSSGWTTAAESQTTSHADASSHPGATADRLSMWRDPLPLHTVGVPRQHGRSRLGIWNGPYPSLSWANTPGWAVGHSLDDSARKLVIVSVN